MPKVSVVIPCYNQAEFLEECVDSVLAQTMQDFEIIIVDDGSSDEKSIKILNCFKKPKTTIIRQKNKGPAVARNVGIKHAKGKYILPLDADDKIAPTVLEKCSQYMDTHKNCGICGGITQFFGDRTDIFVLPKYSYPEILLNNCLVITCMFTKKDWKKVGGFNANMRYGLEDWDFWLSIIELGKQVFQFDEILLFYRKHGESLVSSLSNNAYRHQKMVNQIVKNHKRLYKDFPALVNQMTTVEKSLSIKIKDFLIRILCMFVPLSKWRHAIKDYFKTPCVSVLMPAYNSEKYVGEAIESVLNQTFKDFEFIIINDGSTDNTAQIIEKYAKKDKRIKFINHTKNKGLIGVLNEGLEVCRGEYIARMDSDDVSLPTRFENQVAYMNAHPECGVLGAYFQVFGNMDIVVRHPTRIKVFNILHDQHVGHPTVMLRKSVIDKYGFRYDMNYKHAEDFELWSRMVFVTEIHNLPEILLNYRWSDSNISVIHAETQANVAQRVKQNILNKLTDDIPFQGKIMEYIYQN